MERREIPSAIDGGWDGIWFRRSCEAFPGAEIPLLSGLEVKAKELQHHCEFAHLADFEIRGGRQLK